MTDPEQSAAELFGEALDLPPERRPAFLDQACRDAPELRRLVEQLLLEDQRAGSFLLNPAFTADSKPTQATATLRDESARFRPAQLIANRFLVVRFIARGGMGEVYEARDQFLQSASIALKIIRPEIASDSATSSRFEQEVILARKVVHSNLCPIYEIFRCDEPAPPFLFLTMRLLQGETLYTRFEQSKKLETGQAVDICKQLLAGVAALHAGGVIHRDLKPNNVMLEASGSGLHVSIMDFGLARPHEAANTLFGSGVIAGTPGYMAPELLRGGRPTKATDLFALGVVLHQVLTGERPLASDHGLSLAPSPSLRSTRAPVEWVQAVEGFLSPDPESRTRAFERLWPGQNGAATLPRPSLWKEKGIWYAAVAIAVLLAIALVALKTPSPVSDPLESTQITSSAEPKEGPLFTDGSRLYFDSRGIPSEMAVGGGPIVPMRILERGMLLLDISADASKALGLKVDGEDTLGRGTLWTTAMLGGTPRKVSDHLANGARWSPDGRSVVFFDRRMLYRIGADGENLTKVWEAPTDVNDLAFSPDGRQLSVTVGSSQLSAQLRTLKNGGPEGIALAQQKGLTQANLLARQQAVQDALYPHLQAAGINPFEIMSRYGAVSRLGEDMSGQSTRLEKPQAYGFGKFLPGSLNEGLTESLLGGAAAHFGYGPEALGTYVAAKAPFVLRDIVAGRPLFRGNPTDIGMREAFGGNVGPKPDLGQFTPKPAGALGSVGYPSADTAFSRTPVPQASEPEMGSARPGVISVGPNGQAVFPRLLLGAPEAAPQLPASVLPRMLPEPHEFTAPYTPRTAGRLLDVENPQNAKPSTRKYGVKTGTSKGVLGSVNGEER